ncbi:unnamed protein product [Lactuca virosa]|uniref:Uncharacterized protein n=1 Tax=Lactuca virosa TaxID=75947 RepID=A0AAU9NQF8_9ASTR|nr:unnamed protein product [Lactuca virosa]
MKVSGKPSSIIAALKTQETFNLSRINSKVAVVCRLSIGSYFFYPRLHPCLLFANRYNHVVQISLYIDRSMFDVCIFQLVKRIASFDSMDSNSSDICSPKKFEDVEEKVNPQSDVSKSTCHSDSVSVQIIDFSVHFSPCKSQLERVISEEVFLIAKEEEKLSRKKKGSWLCYVGSGKKLWIYVKMKSWVDLSFIPLKKKVKVSIQSRNGVMKLFDE